MFLARARRRALCDQERGVGGLGGLRDGIVKLVEDSGGPEILEACQRFAEWWLS